MAAPTGCCRIAGVVAKELTETVGALAGMGAAAGIDKVVATGVAGVE
jgi:hypothetical protein